MVPWLGDPGSLLVVGHTIAPRATVSLWVTLWVPMGYIWGFAWGPGEGEEEGF